MDNVTRIRIAQATLEFFKDYADRKPPITPADEQDEMTDLLTDLRHYANDQEIDFARCIEMSETHFNCEVDEESENNRQDNDRIGICDRCIRLPDRPDR